ncbi:MAG: hypothetical protein KCHDKBKB_03034 [Elusimicrobia bacterium]|nr:hypothetical protein [Elusimicrobiota bacterium]
MSGGQKFLFFCMILVAGVFAVIGLRDGQRTEEKASAGKGSIEERTMQRIKTYLRETVPDPEAEIMRRSRLIEHEAGYWQAVKVRAKNAFGGPVFVNWVFRFSMLGDLEQCLPLEEFVAEMMKKYPEIEYKKLLMRWMPPMKKPLSERLLLFRAGCVFRALQRLGRCRGSRRCRRLFCS